MKAFPATTNVDSGRDVTSAHSLRACTGVLGIVGRQCQLNELVGPAGFEPATKGFTLVPMFPKGVDYLFTRAFSNTRRGRWGAGRSSLLSRALGFAARTEVPGIESALR